MPDEEIEFENEAQAEDKIEELTLDNLGTNYIPTPKVGEEVEFVLNKIRKNKNIDATTKDGKKFKTNLTGVDYKIEYVTADGKTFSPKVWEIFGKIKAICVKLKQTSNIKLKVNHIKDGMKEKEGDNYSVHAFVSDEWRLLDRKTNDWDPPLK